MGPHREPVLFEPPRQDPDLLRLQEVQEEERRHVERLHLRRQVGIAGRSPSQDAPNERKIEN